MLTQKELDYIITFKQTHLHRFREIETFVKLYKKSLKQPSQADNPRTFWYTKTDKLNRRNDMSVYGRVEEVHQENREPLEYQIEQ